jgi:hypothetical protein
MCVMYLHPLFLLEIVLTAAVVLLGKYEGMQMYPSQELVFSMEEDAASQHSQHSQHSQLSQHSQHSQTSMGASPPRLAHVGSSVPDFPTPTDVPIVTPLNFVPGIKGRERESESKGNTTHITLC